MERLRAAFWDLIEIVGLVVLVFATFCYFGAGWGLLCLGFVLIAVANVRGR